MNTYIDSQSVILLGGQSADLVLEYDDWRDQFELTADCFNWEDNYRDFVKNYYPNDKVDEELIKDGQLDCEYIGGWYDTLKEINQKLEEYCEHGSWYEFTWGYEDGTPVE